MAKHLIFADESGIDSSHKCYTIGAIKLSLITLELLNNKYDELIRKYKTIGEIKWTKVGDSFGMSNFCLEIFDFIIQNNIELGFIVVKKDIFIKWNDNNETGFYTTYNQLLVHILKVTIGDCEVYIDDKNDSYDKQDEVIEIIGNRMLNKAISDSNIIKVNKSNSKFSKPIQIIDLLTGAINTSTNLYLDSSKQVNEGKKKIIKQLAEKIGWDHLHFDTYPNNRFNIWHFPKVGFRAIPATKEITYKGL